MPIAISTHTWEISSVKATLLNGMLFIIKLAIFLVLERYSVLGQIKHRFLPGKGCGTIIPIKSVVSLSELQHGESCVLIRTRDGTQKYAVSVHL